MLNTERELNDITKDDLISILKTYHLSYDEDEPHPNSKDTLKGIAGKNFKKLGFTSPH